MVRVMAFVVIIFACGMPVAHAAEAIDVTGTGWIGRAKDGGIARLLEFRKDGTFVDMTDQHIYSGIWKYEQGKVGAAVKYREYVTSAEYIMYLAEVIDGKLKGTSFHYDSQKKQKFWEFPFHLEQENTCAGERGICGDRLYCIDPTTRRSMTSMPFLADRGAAAAKSPEKPADFFKDFFCAARLNMTGSIAARVRFPLAYVEIDNTRPVEQGNRLEDKKFTRRQVEARDFPKITLWPVEREKESASLRRQAFDSPPSRDSHGVHHLLLPPYPARPGRSVLSPWPGGDTLWHFSQVEGTWYLDEVWECRGGDRCPVALYCGEGQPKASLPGNKAGQDEDFFDFFHILYCAMHSGNQDLVYSRIRFPLPYDLAHTEGGAKGTFPTSKKLDFYSLYACDGHTMPPSMSVKGDTASVSLQFDGTGCGKTLFFKNLKGAWYLVKIHFGEY